MTSHSNHSSIALSSGCGFPDASGFSRVLGRLTTEMSSVLGVLRPYLVLSSLRTATCTEVHKPRCYYAYSPYGCSIRTAPGRAPGVILKPPAPSFCKLFLPFLLRCLSIRTSFSGIFILIEFRKTALLRLSRALLVGTWANSVRICLGMFCVLRELRMLGSVHHRNHSGMWVQGS
jgi:hypothetical protein